MGDPFDQLMASLDTPLTIVTTAAGGERAGCLVGFQSQSSIDPSRYAVWLSKANHTYRVGLRAEQFAVHFLADDQLALAELFGTVSGDDIDKFRRCDWVAASGGAPLIEACRNRLVGPKVALLDEGGDHVCVVIEPTVAESGGRFRPLRLSGAPRLPAGHGNEERPHPPTERSA